MRLLFFLIVLLLTFSCSGKKKNQNNTDNANYQVKNYQDNSASKYEYRTGQSGSYNYNYDVDGYDDNGREVYGNVDISGKTGYGYIVDQDDNVLSIDVEWVDYGELEGYDENGEYYALYTQ